MLLSTGRVLYHWHGGEMTRRAQGLMAIYGRPLVEVSPDDAERLYVSNDHRGNLFECMRTRKDPICAVEIGHRSASVCHLGAIALRTGKTLKWDPEKETIIGDREAAAHLERPYRKPWDQVLRSFNL